MLYAREGPHKAHSATDRGASKALACFLVLIGVALTLAPWFLNSLSSLTALRCLLLAMLVFGFAIKYWRGESTLHLLRSMMRHWIPWTLFLYMYFTLGRMAISVIKVGELPEDFAINGGALMMSGSFLAMVTCLVQAFNLNMAAKAEGKTARAPIFACRLYAFLSFAFFLGGLFMLTWATGWADWFVVHILGW